MGSKGDGNNYAQRITLCLARPAACSIWRLRASLWMAQPILKPVPKTKTNIPRYQLGIMLALYLSQNPGSGELCHNALGPSLCAFALLPFQNIYHTPSPPLTLLQHFCLLRPCTLTSLCPPSETPPYLGCPATRFFILYRRSVAIKSKDTRSPIVSRRAPTHALVTSPYITIDRRPYELWENRKFLCSFTLLYCLNLRGMWRTGRPFLRPRRIYSPYRGDGVVSKRKQ